MSGVSNFVLVDPDVLEEHNVVRHAADLRYIGMPKVSAVKDLILNRNPTANVEAIDGNIMDCVSALSDVDFVLVAGLGSEITTTNLAIKLRELGKIALFGGVYEKAVAGEVFVVFPNVGPCYSCFASKLRVVEAPFDDREVDYGLPPDELKAQPGLGAHISRVAAVFADWTIRLAVHEASIMPYFPGNIVILSNEEYNLGNDRSGNPIVIPPSSSSWLTMRKLHKCNVCGQTTQVSVPIEQLLKELDNGNSGSASESTVS